MTDYNFEGLGVNLKSKCATLRDSFLRIWTFNETKRLRSPIDKGHKSWKCS